MMSLNRILFLLCTLSVLTGTSIVVFNQTSTIASLAIENPYTFLSATKDFSRYKEMKTAWKPRVLSNYSAALLFKSILPPTIDLEGGHHPAFSFVVGVWSVTWFILICLVFIYWKPHKAIYYILGLLSAMCFGYTPGLEYRVYPWDLPSVFCFSMALFLITKRKYILLILLISISAGFKETIGIFCLSFLFIEENLRKKIVYTFVSVFLFVIVKASIDYLVQSPTLFLTMEISHQSPNVFGVKYLPENIKVTINSVTPLFVNSGTLIALLLLPVKSYELLRLKFLAALFIIGNYIFGIVTEYRIWFEMIPLSLYGFEIAFQEYKNCQLYENLNNEQA